MPALQRLILRARRRRLIDAALLHAARSTALALLAAIVLLAVDRFFALHLPWLVYAILSATGIVAGVMMAWMHRPTPLEVAVDLDRTLHLRDQLGSALALQTQSRPTDDPLFALLVQQEVQRLAVRLDARGATPIRLTRHWLLAALLAAGFVLAFQFVPTGTFAPSQPLALSSEQVQIMAATQGAIASSLKDVKERLSESRDAQIAETVAQRDLQTLDRLAQQFASMGQDPSATLPQLQQLRDESVAQLSEMADRIEKEARREAAAIDELTQRFAGLNDPAANPPLMSAEQFTQALQLGDFGHAADVLDQLARDAPNHDPQAREALADFLSDLRERLARQEATADRSLHERAEQLEQSLRDQGLDEHDITDLLPHPLRATHSEPLAHPADSTQESASSQPPPEPQANQDAPPPAEDTDAPHPSPPPVVPKQHHDTSSSPATRNESSDDSSSDPNNANADDRRQQTASTRPDQSTAADMLRERGIDERIAEELARDLQTLQQQRDVNERATEKSQQLREAIQSTADQINNPTHSNNQPQSGSSTPHNTADQPPPSKLPSPDQTSRSQTNDPTSHAASSTPEQPTDASRPEPSSSEPDPAAIQKAMEFLGQDRMRELADKVDPQAMRDLIDKVDPQMLKELVDRIDPETLQKLAERFQRTAPQQESGGERTPPPVDPETLRQLAEKLDPATLQKLADKFRDLQSPSPPERSPPSQLPQQTAPQQDPATETDQPSSSTSPGSTGESPSASLRRPGDALRELEQRRQTAQRQQQTAESVREAARDIMQSMTPQQQRAWTDAWQRQQDPDSLAPNDPLRPGPSGSTAPEGRPIDDSSTAPPRPQGQPSSEDLDIAGQAPADQIIAQWLSDHHVEPGEALRTTAAGTAPPAEPVAAARRLAERAVNESAVPARYHTLIRRYFDRLNRTVERAAGDSAANAATPPPSSQPAPAGDNPR